MMLVDARVEERTMPKARVLVVDDDYVAKPFSPRVPA